MTGDAAGDARIEDDGDGAGLRFARADAPVRPLRRRLADPLRRIEIGEIET